MAYVQVVTDPGEGFDRRLTASMRRLRRMEPASTALVSISAGWRR
ncbi:hypothetical protein [Actinoplanes philippinensis]